MSLSEVTSSPLYSPKRMLYHSIQKGSGEHFALALKSFPNPEEAGRGLRKLLKRVALQERGASFRFILENLRRLFPQINDYVTQVKRDQETIDVLSSRTLQMKIDELLAKGKIKFFCLLCENYNELDDQLKRFFRSQDQRALFIVRNQYRGATPPILHVSPVLIERQGAGFRCIITDSMGGDNLFGDLIAKIVRGFLEKETSEFQIFCYRGPARQRAPTNCTLFGIWDALAFSKMVHLFRFCEEQSRDLSPDRRMIYFHQLPEPMMRISQDPSQSSDVHFIEKKFLKYLRRIAAFVVQNHSSLFFSKIDA